jgi:hypothetical protein
LLNSLLSLNGKKSAFVVGNTVNACTKGLWIWGGACYRRQQQQWSRSFACAEPVELEDGMKVLFLDSEGLGSTSRTQTEDCQIFSLAILLSSLFIWNSRGVIDGLRKPGWFCQQLKLTGATCWLQATLWRTLGSW